VKATSQAQSAPGLIDQLKITGGMGISQQRLVKHARYYWLLLAEGHLTRGGGSML